MFKLWMFARACRACCFNSASIGRPMGRASFSASVSTIAFAVVVFWSYTAGSLSERVTALEKRMDRLEAQALQISQDALVRSDRLERRMGDLEIQILRAISRGALDK